MPIPHLCRFTYGLSGDFTPSLPPRAWTPMDETLGGVEITATGIPVSYIVRRDQEVELTLRFGEDEWDAVLALVEWGQSGQEMQWYPDALLTDPDYDASAVYLQSPAAGERWGPTRDGQYPRTFEVTLMLRGVGGVLPFTRYYPAD